MPHLTIREPRPDGFSEDGLAPVHSWRSLSGTICAYGYEGQGARWMRWPGLVSFRFDDQGAIDAFPERDLSPSYIVDLCRRTVEPLVLQALGCETLHASAVVMDGGLAAFCGERESGKSTIAYALSQRGHRQVADDTVVFDVAPRDIRAVPLSFGVRLRPEAHAFFGAPHAEDQPVSVAADRPSAAGLPISAIFVLRRRAILEPVAVRLTSAAAFTALLAHAHCFDPETPASRQRTLEQYLEMAAAVPVYELCFPAGLERLTAVLSCIEQVVATPALAGQL